MEYGGFRFYLLDLDGDQRTITIVDRAKGHLEQHLRAHLVVRRDARRGAGR